MKEFNQDPQLPLWQKSLQASINSAFQVSTKAIPSMVFSAGGAFLGGVAYGPAGAAIGAAGGSIIADALTKDFSGVGSLAEGLVGGTINSARFFIVKGGEMVQAGVTESTKASKTSHKTSHEESISLMTPSLVAPKQLSTIPAG